ncbi:MAG TPA: acyltransferase [Candidatus Saccharimonadales bacterium]|nr:acyltransferase [Candidatus Saccharimonadales bacterium]
MKLRYLDGLRGLAALIVVLDHFAISFFPAATDGSVHTTHGALESVVQQTPLHILVSGNFSVCIFFVLSGFVLSAKFFRTRDRHVVVASAIKRYFRLALPVLGCVMLAFILMATHAFFNVQAGQITGSDWLASFWQFQPDFKTALSEIVIVFIRGSSGYNAVLWTMKTELVGSFLVFAILLSVGRWRYRWLAYLVVGLLLIKTYYLTFVCGVALCDYHYNGAGQLAFLRRRRYWLPLLAGCLFLGSSPEGTLHGTVFQYFINVMPPGMTVTTTTHIVGAIGLVLAIANIPMLQRLLVTKPMLYLGKISFSLYLTHFLVIGSLSSFLFIKIAPVVGYRIGFVLMAVASGLAIWLAAHLFTKYIDEPSIRLSAMIERLRTRLTSGPNGKLARLKA